MDLPDRRDSDFDSAGQAALVAPPRQGINTDSTMNRHEKEEDIIHDEFY